MSKKKKQVSLLPLEWYHTVTAGFVTEYLKPEVTNEMMKAHLKSCIGRLYTPKEITTNSGTIWNPGEFCLLTKVFVGSGAWSDFSFWRLNYQKHDNFNICHVELLCNFIQVGKDPE